jgi:hypothetical protein
MSQFGSEDSTTGGLPARRAAPMVQEDPRRAPGDALGHGTLACPCCDAPLALPAARAAAEPTACPFCGHRASLGSFVSLASPTRPTRVVVRVTARA